MLTRRSMSRLRPAVESLEPRLALALAAVAGPVAPGGSPAGLVRVVQSGLVVSVKTDKLVYKVGQPIHITITETNTSNHDARVLIGCQILTALATKGRVEVWQFRDLRLCPTGIGVLPAHQSRQFQVVWDQRFNHPVPPGTGHTGTFVVHAGVDGLLGTVAIQLKP